MARDCKKCKFFQGMHPSHLIEASDAPGPELQKKRIFAKKTAEYRKLCYVELAEGERLELWQTPEGKLLFRKESR